MLATPLDEMVDGAGRTRRHWRTIVDGAFALGADRLRERAILLERAALEEGIASVLPGAEARAWRCDPIPIPIPAAEFATLVDGLAQRARLLDLALADLYGPQTLIERGVVPPSFLFRNPAFLRAARSPDPGAGWRRPRLAFYAADLIRDADGEWRVLADRSTRTGGVAIALENRRLLRRIMPELFRRDVAPLDPFFERWRERLRAASPEPRPGLALLTQGHRDPDWFEHVLLSRELRLDLVQGGDLTLRGGRLFLKTMRGLKRVDVLLNRQPAALLDPLELDWHGSAGVPGLMSAWRGGRVAILNDPGAGLAEQPGMAALLPAIAACLTGERLRLRTLETLWLGEDEARTRLLDRPEDWLLRPAGRDWVPPVSIAALSRRARARALAAVERDPEHFVAVAHTSGSVAPVVEPARLAARPVAFRFFLLRDGDRWTALAGGLARIVPADGHSASTLPSDGIAKDIFILADDEQPERIPLQAALPLDREPPLAVRRTEGDIPARVAENFFRLGRQLEMLETGARLVRALALRLGRFAHRPRELIELRILAACLLPFRLVGDDLLIDPTAPGLADALVRLGRADGLLADATRALLTLVEQLRDRLTADMHFILTQTLGDVLGAFAGVGYLAGLPGGAGEVASLDQLAHVTGRLLAFAATLAGLAAETMVRGGGRLFLELGMRLTRAEQVCHQLRTCLGPAASLPGRGDPDLDLGLSLALELRDSAITYRARYFGRLEPLPALDLMLADLANPRALGSQLESAATLLAALGEVGGTGLSTRAADLASLNARLLEPFAPGAEPDIEALTDRLADMGAGIVELRRAITRRYVDLLPEMHTLG